MILLCTGMIFFIFVLLASICVSLESKLKPDSTDGAMQSSQKKKGQSQPQQQQQQPQPQQQQEQPPDYWHFDPQFGSPDQSNGINPTTNELLDGLLAYDPPDWDNHAFGEYDFSDFDYVTDEFLENLAAGIPGIPTDNPTVAAAVGGRHDLTEKEEILQLMKVAAELGLQSTNANVIKRLRFDIMRRQILWLEHLLRMHFSKQPNDSLNSSQKALGHYINNAEENELEMPNVTLNLGPEETNGGNLGKRKQRHDVIMEAKPEQDLFAILPKQFILKMPQLKLHFTYNLAVMYKNSLEQDYLKMDENLYRPPNDFLPNILMGREPHKHNAFAAGVAIDREILAKLDPAYPDDNLRRYFKYYRAEPEVGEKVGKLKARCRNCLAEISRTGSNTKGMTNHLKARHRQLLDLYNEAKTITSLEKKQHQKSVSEKEQKKRRKRQAGPGAENNFQRQTLNPMTNAKFGVCHCFCHNFHEICRLSFISV